MDRQMEGWIYKFYRLLDRLIDRQMEGWIYKFYRQLDRLMDSRNIFTM